MCKATKYQLSKLQCSVCGLGILVTEGRLVDVAVGVADLEGGGALQRRYHAQLGDTEDQEDGNIRDTAQGGEKRCIRYISHLHTMTCFHPPCALAG